MSKEINLLEINNKRRFILQLSLFILISIALSLFIFSEMNKYNNNFNNDIDYVKDKATEMIENKNFEAKDGVIIKSCNLDIINDTLTMEVKYKTTNISVEATGFSSDNITISFTRLDVPIENIPVLLYVFCLFLSLVVVGIAFFVFNGLIDLFSHFGSILLKKYKLSKLKKLKK